MTELDKMKRAKMYIDKLANGTNPLNDLTLPESDIVNNVRISRCLFYVSDVLRQVIENDGAVSKKKIKKIPFDLPVEKRAAFEYSDYSISISEIAKRINALIDKDLILQLKYSSISSWLVEIGMLRVEERADNKTVKRPTSHGNSIGITVEERVGRDRNYHVVIYDRNAQKFIIDNLDAIIEINNKR